MTIQTVRTKQDTLQVRLDLHKVFDRTAERLSNAGSSTFDRIITHAHQHPATGDLFCHFDRTGRFLRATARDITLRRGLDNRLMMVAIDTSHRDDLKWFGRRRTYTDFTEAEKAAFFEVVYADASATLLESAHSRPGDSAPTDAHPESMQPETMQSEAAEPGVAQSGVAQSGVGPSAETVVQLNAWRELLQRWTPESLAADETAFQQTYKPISILPPDQYKTLVVQVAEGCSYNECLFCDFYRDRRFHVKSPRELEAHLDAIVQFFGPRLVDRTGIFLGDGNALVVSADRLMVAIKQIREALRPPTGPITGPLAESFATFMDTFNLDKKSVEALHTLRQAGVDTVYVGLESGYDPIRQFLKKPGPATEALAAIRTLKKAGYTVGPIVMIGVGDATDADAHFEHTVRLLQDAGLTTSDKIFLSPFVQPSHGEYRDAAETLGVTPYTEDKIEREMMRWKDTLNKTTKAKVTGYYVREHIY